MPGLRVIKAAANDPVPLDVVKSHMKVTFANDDALIEMYLEAATEKVEGFLSRSLITKTYVLSLDHFPHLHHAHSYGGHSEHHGYRHHHPLQIKLPRSPLAQVPRVEYLDLQGVRQTMLPRLDQPWRADTIYVLGAQILDPNGKIQEVTGDEEEGGGDPAFSGGSIPTFGTNPGDTVDDGEIQWTCKGPAPAGDFLVDTNGEPGRIYPNINTNNYYWPYTQRVPNAVQIYFVAGYGDNADAVPAIFKTPLMIYVKGLYDFRDPLLTTPGSAPQELPSHLRDLLSEHRIKDFAPTEG
jgi:hypothetical protein